MRSQPLIAVRDVKASSSWYRRLLGAESMSSQFGEHEHNAVYDRVLSGDDILLQLHAWDHEEHPNLTKMEKAAQGHGVLLWFETADFDATVARARALGAAVIEEPHVNPNARHRECWIRDPDDYVVEVASPDGEAD